jgi:hypothetical protein
VRKDSAYKEISSDERENVYGKFTLSVNIPSDQISQSYSKIPKDVPILVVDEFGNNANCGCEATHSKWIFKSECTF